MLLQDTEDTCEDRHTHGSYKNMLTGDKIHLHTHSSDVQKL